jgi:hypothetical protein
MSAFQYTITIPPPNGVKTKTVTFPLTDDHPFGFMKKKQYTILNYSSEKTDETNGNYRSVIVDTSTNTPLSFSPVKSIPYAEFIQKYPTPTEDIQINEMVEGTMIHLFYVPEVEDWQIATKSAVGGDCWYFHETYGKRSEYDVSIPKTFREMVYDALMHIYPSFTLSDSSFIKCLPKNYSYCFVLQHPENHLVFHVERPVIVLVSVFAFSATEQANDYAKNSRREAEGSRGNSGERSSKEFGVSFIPQCEFSKISPYLIPFSYGGYSPAYEGQYHTKVNEWYAEHCSRLNTTPFCKLHVPECMQWTTFEPIVNFENRKGYVLTNIRTGERTKLENPEYLKLKELRGNHPNLQYQYFALVRMGKVNEFLKYFPMYSALFRKLYHQYRTFITVVHQTYVSYYIHKKTDTLFMKKYFIHAANLHHKVYIPSLSEEKMVITHRVVREYFDQMQPRELLYFLHYDETR